MTRDLDLSGAILDHWDLSDCRVGSVDFTETHFCWVTLFLAPHFQGDVSLGGASFCCSASFIGASSRSKSRFSGT